MVSRACLPLQLLRAIERRAIVDQRRRDGFPN